MDVGSAARPSVRRACELWPLPDPLGCGSIRSTPHSVADRADPTAPHRLAAVPSARRYLEVTGATVRDARAGTRGRPSSSNTYLGLRAAHRATAGRSSQLARAALSRLPGARRPRSATARPARAEPSPTRASCRLRSGTGSRLIDPVLDAGARWQALVDVRPSTRPGRSAASTAARAGRRLVDRPPDDAAALQLDGAFGWARPEVQRPAGRRDASRAIATAATGIRPVVHPPQLYWTFARPGRTSGADDRRLARRLPLGLRRRGGRPAARVPHRRRRRRRAHGVRERGPTDPAPSGGIARQHRSGPSTMTASRPSVPSDRVVGPSRHHLPEQPPGAPPRHRPDDHASGCSWCSPSRAAATAATTGGGGPSRCASEALRPPPGERVIPRSGCSRPRRTSAMAASRWSLAEDQAELRPARRGRPRRRPRHCAGSTSNASSEPVDQLARTRRAARGAPRSPRTAR